nr:MAG TPA: hypothetical protein [Bacteriophage sp.]
MAMTTICDQKHHRKKTLCYFLGGFGGFLGV